MDERKQLHLLGVSFRTAPVAIREALSFNPVESADMLHAAQAAVPRLEFMVLSTCNRTEFCFAAPAASHAVALYSPKTAFSTGPVAWWRAVRRSVISWRPALTI
jgi:glutamyl-tRNA reductase